MTCMDAAESLLLPADGQDVPRTRKRASELGESRRLEDLALDERNQRETDRYSDGRRFFEN